LRGKLPLKTPSHRAVFSRYRSENRSILGAFCKGIDDAEVFRLLSICGEVLEFSVNAAYFGDMRLCNSINILVLKRERKMLYLMGAETIPLVREMHFSGAV